MIEVAIKEYLALFSLSSLLVGVMIGGILGYVLGRMKW